MNILQITKQIGIFLILITLTACARNQPWRTEIHPIVNDKNPCDKSPCCSASPEGLEEKECIIEYITDENNNDLYRLGFLEFTDRGNLFDNQARDDLLGRIEKDAEENGALVIVFAHGWNHNSSFTDENVQQFREALRKISSMEGVKRGRPVYGIYIGWRGKILPTWLNIALTFWDRKSIAQAIGKGGVSDILLRLELIKRKYQDKDNTLVITGHSFGAASLLSGLNEILLQRILESKYKKELYSGQQETMDDFADGVFFVDPATEESRHKKEAYSGQHNTIDYFADGVVLVNPAIEAGEIFQLYENAMELNLDEENRRSLITIITSEDDKATRFLFPIGQALDTIFTKQEQLERDYTPQKISEYGLDTTTIGHYKPFHTGNLIDEDTIRNNKYLDKLFFGPKKTNEKENHSNENDNEFNLNQWCRGDSQKETISNPNPLGMDFCSDNRNACFHDPNRNTMLPIPNFEESPDVDAETRDLERTSTRASITNKELIEKFQIGYVDCCENPKGCILSNEENDIICNKNNPLSFIYTNKALIKDHNDVFNDEFLAYLLAGVTGTVFKERSICNNEDVDGKEEKVIEQIEELIKGCSKVTDQPPFRDFSFSGCYSHFYKSLRDLQKKK